ncbi:MAG TPA: sulfatase-like hydrolase/transferase [Chthoniobacteraceae bacterium]|nr:sulfatase-like hydrolase/transferase [Chthoniobacteraceae bacterium]
MIFPILILWLNRRLRRVFPCTNRALFGEFLLLLGLAQFPVPSIAMALLACYAVVFSLARSFFLRVSRPVDRYSIRYAWAEPRNAWQIIIRERSPAGFIQPAVLLCAAWADAYMRLFPPPFWISAALMVGAWMLLRRSPQSQLTVALRAIIELIASFSRLDRDKRLCAATRQKLAPIPATAGELPDVLFIVCESLSKRILESDDGRKAAPFYHAFLERQGNVFSFPNAIANSTTSDIAYATLFTGLPPDAGHKAFHQQPLIWSAARARGYHTSFYTSQGLSWLNMDAFFIDDTLDIAVTRETLGAPCVNDMAMDDRLLNRRILEDWKTASAVNGAPRFCVVNYNMLHVPFLSDDEKQPPHERYLNALGILDRCLCELIERLESDGRLERTAIVFTGDHGEIPRDEGSSGPEENPDRLYRFHPDLLRVPLWIRVPGAAPGIVAQLGANREKSVSNLDLYPTLLGLLGFPAERLPAAPGGCNLLEEIPKHRKIIALNAGDLRAWSLEPFASLTGPHLFLYQDMDRHFELYDLQGDPACNLWKQLAPAAQKHWFARSSHPALSRILKKRGIRRDELALSDKIAAEYNSRAVEDESAPLHELNNWHLFSAEDWEEFCLHTARAIGIKPRDHVFEAGCGAGAFLEVLQRHYDITMEGVDIAGNLITVARKRLPGRFHVGDIQRMPYVPDKTFDAVVSHGVFLYLPSASAVWSAASELVRIVKPGGVVYIGVLNDPERIANYQSGHKPSGQALVPRSFWSQFAIQNGLQLELIDQEKIYQKPTGYDAHARLRYSVCLRVPERPPTPR